MTLVYHDLDTHYRWACPQKSYSGRVVCCDLSVIRQRTPHHLRFKYAIISLFLLELRNKRMDEKLVRQIVFVVLGIIAILAVVSLVSTLVQMIIPLAVIAIGGFAFYKIVLEGRDASQAMEDEVAETSALVVESTSETVIPAQETTEVQTPEETEQQAKERLSAVEQAKRDYVDSVTPAEEILENIKARKQRLQGDDEA